MHIFDILNFLDAHLWAITSLKEMIHHDIFTPYSYQQFLEHKPVFHSKKLMKMLPKVHFTKFQKRNIAYENWKNAEKNRKKMLFLLKKYHINTPEWQKFFFYKNVNYANYREFIIKTEQLFECDDMEFFYKNKQLEAEPWTKTLNWMIPILQNYRQYRNLHSK